MEAADPENPGEVLRLGPIRAGSYQRMVDPPGQHHEAAAGAGGGGAGGDAAAVPAGMEMHAPSGKLRRKSSLIAMKTHAKRGWGKLRGTVIGAGGFKKKKKDRKKAMRERSGSLASSISTHGKGP